MAFDLNAFATNPFTMGGIGALGGNIGRVPIEARAGAFQGLLNGLQRGNRMTLGNREADLREKRYNLDLNDQMQKMAGLSAKMQEKNAINSMIDKLNVDDGLKTALKSDPELRRKFFALQNAMDVPSPQRQVYELTKARAGRSQTNNVFSPQMGGNTPLDLEKYWETMGKELAKVDVTTMDAANKAKSSMARHQQLEFLLDEWEKTGGEPSMLAPIYQQIASFAESVGVDPASINIANAGPGQALESLTNEMALGKIGGEDGMPANNFSDADRKFVVSTVPRISNTPEGFRLKLLMQRAMDNRALEAERFMIDNHAKMSPMERRKAWSDWVRGNPIFKRGELNGHPHIKIGEQWYPL